MRSIALEPGALVADHGDDAWNFAAVGRAAVQAAGVADKYVTGLDEQRLKGDVAGVDFGEGLFFRQQVGAAGDLERAELGADVYEGEVDCDQRRQLVGSSGKSLPTSAWTAW